jgi:hypothetical protein
MTLNAVKMADEILGEKCRVANFSNNVKAAEQTFGLI